VSFSSPILLNLHSNTLISRNTSFTYFPNTPNGDDMFSFFRQVVAFHPIHSTLAAQDWDVTSSGSHFALALFTFLYVDIVDATATLYSMARFSGVVDPLLQTSPAPH
jgi:AGZA family xanthine/uracil permease-like MFS transporter